MPGGSRNIRLLSRPLPVLLALILLVAAFQYVRALPVTAASPTISVSVPVGTAPVFPWPARGEAALTVEGIGEVGSSGGQTPIPMASTTKIMTALLVLEDHPLALNEPGPVLTVTRADVGTFIAERNQNESVVPVVAGEQLSEYQLLQGLLLPSASNFADLLATWDKGSKPAFINQMNARAMALGMSAAHYADVSGFSPLSVGTPADLITLAQVAMAQPVFAQIVRQSEATLPAAGVVRNLDTLLGQGGIIGVKTGHTDQAGGCFVMAADLNVDGQMVRVYGAVMGQPSALSGAFAATTALLRALTPALHWHTVVHRRQPAAQYHTPWEESGLILTGAAAGWVLLDGTLVSQHVTLKDLPPMLPAGSRVGTLVVDAGIHHAEIQLVTAAAINGPSLAWRLTRGF